MHSDGTRVLRRNAMRDDSEEVPLTMIPEPRLRELMNVYGSPARWDKRTIPTKLLIEQHEIATLCAFMLSHLPEERLKRLRARRG